MMQRPKQTLLTSQQWLFIIVGTSAIFLIMAGLRPDIVPSWVGFALICGLGAIALWRTPHASAEVSTTAIISERPDLTIARRSQIAPDLAAALKLTLSQQELNIQEQVSLTEHTNT